MSKARHSRRLRRMQAQAESRVPPEGDECPECGAENWHYSQGFRGSLEEPSEPAGRECRECGNVQTEPTQDDDAAYESWKESQGDEYFDLGKK